jgi:hypothetical protein
MVAKSRSKSGWAVRAVDQRMRQLDARFAAAEGDYASLKRRSEARVVVWRWTREGCFSPYPYWFERERFNRGEVLAREPVDKRQHHAYGLDVRGRVVVERQHTAEAQRFYETFYEHSEDGGVRTHGVRYHHDGSGRPINVETFEHDAVSGALLIAERRAQYGCSRERYRREAGRIGSIEIDYSEIVEGKVTPLQPYQRVEIDHDPLGRVIEVRKIWPSDESQQVRVVYKRPQTTLGYAALCRLVEQRLLEAIPRAVERASIAETACCVVLAYDTEAAEPLPPLLGVGLVRERDELLASAPEVPLPSLLWNPAEFSLFDLEALALDDDTSAGRDLESAWAALVAQMRRRGRVSDLARLLSRVAWELSGRDWSTSLPVSDDFVIYATDLQLCDLGRNMRASLFPERLRELRRRGWLPLEPRR